MSALVVFFWGGAVFSQDATEKELVSLNDKLSKEIEYLDFREVDIKDVLRQLAKQHDLNIIFSESVKGLITVQLHNVTLSQALDSIITVNGFVYTRKGNVIKVTTSAEADQEIKQTRIFRLNNADASQLSSSLQKVLSAEGSIQIDARSNSLIITDTPTVLSKVEDMIPSLDEITPQVLIEARFIETTLGTTEQLGLKWTVTGELSGAQRTSTFPFTFDGNKDFTEFRKRYFPSADPAATGTGQDLNTPYGFPYASSGDLTVGSLDFSAFKTVLDFLKTETDSKLISSPRVVTVDNKPAEMYVGKARPIPNFTYNDQTGDYEISGFSEKIEGVTLSVTPQVSRGPNNTYNIKLKLKPKVTNFNNEGVSFSGSISFTYPILSERYADTEVIVEDGQTIVIGGLIEDKKTSTQEKVPFLGDLPIIGLLFTHKNINPNQKTELLIFVTATVVKEKDKRLAAYDSPMMTSPGRPFKLNLREVKVK